MHSMGRRMAGHPGPRAGRCPVFPRHNWRFCGLSGRIELSGPDKTTKMPQAFCLGSAQSGESRLRLLGFARGPSGQETSSCGHPKDGGSNMADRNRRGFTLVELLVVVVIIAMLMALLLPAINSARAKARQAQCTSHQQNIAKAVQQYETAKGSLPGYINSFGALGPSGSNRTPLSWPIVLLPYLGHEDLWKRWRDSGVSMADKLDRTSPDCAVVDLPELRCPSDNFSGEDAPLSYVANCGIPDGTSSEQLEYMSGKWTTTGTRLAEGPAHGVFHNRYNNSSLPPVTSSRIVDGLQMTILISENIQAGFWFDVDEGYIGIVWRDGVLTNWDPGPRVVNVGQDAPSRPPLDPLDPLYARPSSMHAGGVVVTYCDGRTDFLNEDIFYRAYISLLTTDNARAKGPPDTLD